MSDDLNDVGGRDLGDAAKLGWIDVANHFWIAQLKARPRAVVRKRRGPALAGPRTRWRSAGPIDAADQKRAPMPTPTVHGLKRTSRAKVSPASLASALPSR